ncbi:DUF2780 domain-containing protein [Thaumasiovibrio subtropicus]|uniref:DUF2780 domain-containing protein n=1 Tax=Thaumasiovibrio subtropicus TaxID=1891207 RepID=UPI000B363BAA|nr:DUF2780 domain-containing protein [Thaumasiovibrio subtropicus]
MKYTTLAVLASLTLPVHAFSFDDALKHVDEETVSTASSLLDKGLATLDNKATEASPLVSLLSDQIDVSPTQAAGGAGALLALASNSLGNTQGNELTALIPGLDSLTSAIPSEYAGVLEGAKGLSNVMSAFDALGIDPALISQFAPIILQYLGDQGATQGLLGSLTSLWQPA